ncbi:hypothetical protein AAES_68357 [Amazona aestiva]|uniref:Uncharacterized protein n=1 Tax=Amazona aestiva TaxID=12930 RepID=A0A0Q3RB61_AMAAE|nr:hypothetical protein AAES_68357 [Amazona aestiva]
MPVAKLAHDHGSGDQEARRKQLLVEEVRVVEEGKEAATEQWEEAAEELSPAAEPSPMAAKSIPQQLPTEPCEPEPQEDAGDHAALPSKAEEEDLDSDKEKLVQMFSICDCFSTTSFEDGTVSFLDIIALKHGFDVLEKLTGGMEKIKQHTFALAHYTYNVLSTLKYANGAPVIRIYSDTDFSNPDVQGPIINFNILDENGEVIGFSQTTKNCELKSKLRKAGIRDCLGALRYK